MVVHDSIFELKPDPLNSDAKAVKLRVALFEKVSNAKELRDLLTDGKIEASFIRAELVTFSFFLWWYFYLRFIQVLEGFQLLAAANRAASCHTNNRMATKNIHTELVYSLSPTKNVSFLRDLHQLLALEMSSSRKFIKNLQSSAKKSYSRENDVVQPVQLKDFC